MTAWNRAGGHGWALFSCSVALETKHDCGALASGLTDIAGQFISVTQLCPPLCYPWTVARQASLSITSSQRLLKLMSIELVMPYYHLMLCGPLLLLPSTFPSISIFTNDSVFTSGGQSIGASASPSVLPKIFRTYFLYD